MFIFMLAVPSLAPFAPPKERVPNQETQDKFKAELFWYVNLLNLDSVKRVDFNTL